MGRQKITICVRNKEYGRLLVRGLCNECTGLYFVMEDEIEKAQENMEGSILVTDYNVPYNPKILFLSDYIPQKEEECIISKLMPIKEIFLKIAEISCLNYGTMLKIKSTKDTKFISVFSHEGGSGVTSISITLGRILSAYGNKVLYLNQGPLDDYMKYIDIKFEMTSSKRQYYFFAEEGLPRIMEMYLEKDQWGLFYFKPEKEYNSLFNELDIHLFIEYVIQDMDFTHIIIDRGKRYYDYSEKEEVVLEIIDREKNLVLSEEGVENKLLIINNSNYRRVEDNKFYIRNDKNSFIEKGENVGISMGGRFSDDVELLLNSKKYLFRVL